MKKMFKRALLSLLSLALTFTMVQYKPLHVHAHDGQTLTSAEVIANNYSDLKKAVKAVLTSGGLNVKEYTYEVPADSSLVTVDAKTKTVTAQSHTDEFGNKWTPEEVYVTEGGVEKKCDRNGDTWQLTGVGDKYSVRVVYRSYVSIATDEQLRLLNSAMNLWYVYDFVCEYMEEAGDQVSLLEMAIPELNNTLIETKAELTTGLADGKAQLQEGKELKAELEAGLVEAQDALKQAQDALKQAQDGKAELETALKEAKDKKAEADDLLAQAKAERDNLVAQGKPAAVIAAANAKIAEGEAAIKELEDGIKEIENAIKQADDAIKQIKDGIKEIEDGIAQAEDYIAQANDAIAEGEKLIAEGEKALKEIAKIEAIVKVLTDQLDANGQLDLHAEIKTFNKYASKDQYIEYLYSSNVDSLKAEVKELVDVLEQLLAYEDYMGSYASELEEVIESLTYGVDDDAEEDYWSTLYFGSKQPLVNLSADLAKLNAAILSVKSGKDVPEYDAGDVTAKLLLAETSISASVAMHDVDLVINAVAYDQDGKEFTLEETTSVTVDDGSTLDNIVELPEADSFYQTSFTAFKAALAEIADGYTIEVGETYSVSVNSADTNKDGEIDTVTVTYTPNEFNFIVSANDKVVSTTPVNYGSFVTLPEKTGEGSYEYVIDGIGFDQLQTYRVLKETTALRTETTVEKTVKPIFEVVAKDTFYNLNDITKNILLNKALLSPLTSYVALSEKNPAQVTLEYDDVNRVYVLKAPKYKAYVDDMEWVPAAYSVNGEAKVAMNGATEVEITGKVSDVEVFYELKVTKNASTGENVITVTEDLLKEWINLPYELVADVKGQKEVLDTLASWTGEGGYLTMGSVINLALGFIEDSYEARYGVNSPEYEAIQTLRKVCLDADKNLVILEYVEMYKTLGLIAYYSEDYGYAKYKEQLNTLVECLDIIVSADEFENVKDSLAGMGDGVGDKIDQVEEIQVSLSEANDKLVAPNKYLDTTHADFDSLLALLQSEAAKNVMKVEDTTHGLHDYYSTKVINELENFIYKIDLYVNGGVDDGKHFTYSFAVALEDLYDVDAIVAKINEFIAQVDTKHYTLEKDYTAKLPQPGDRANKNQSLEIVYNVNEYTIRIEDEEGKKVSTSTIEYANHSMTLDQSSTNEYYYVYVVAGKEYNTKTGSLPLNITAGSEGNFDTLFVDGQLTIVRKEISLKEELGLELQAYVANLNKGFAGLNSGFILVEKGGDYEIVLRIDPSEASSLSSGLMDMAMEIINAKYGYIALGKEDNAFFDTKITLQALVNALLYSDFSSKTLTDLFNENGQINDNVKLEGNNVVVGGSVNLKSEIGGLLLDTRLVLGTNPNNIEHNIPFYVTLEDFGNGSADLATADKALEILTDYVTFDTENDEFNVVATLPDAGYQVLLAAMIYAGYADLDAVADVDKDEFLQYFVDQYDELVHADVALSAEAIQNTLNKLGVDLSVKEYATYIDGAIAVLKHLTLKVENGKIDGELTADANTLLAKVPQIPEAVSSIIVGDLYAPLNAELTNLGTAYDAIVVDAFNDSKEIYKSFGLSKDIEKDITNVANNAVVVLLADAEELKVNANVILDLNGFNVESIKVADGAHLRIFDSAIEDGTVYSLDGENITLVGGTYRSSFAVFGLLRASTNVEQYLPEGYVQNANGTVSHQFFSLTETSEGIEIEINPDLSGLTKEDIKAMNLEYLAADLALTLGLRYFNATSLTIDDNEIVGINDTFADLVALYADTTRLELVNEVVDILNCTGVQDFVNESLIAKLTDFDAIANAIKTNGVVAKYKVAYNPLTAGLDVVKSAGGNYVTGGIKENEDLGKKDTLIIKINQETANKYQVPEFLGILADVLTITDETKLTFTDINVNKLAASTDAVSSDIAFTGKAIVEFKEAKYTVLMATILAYGTNDAALIDALGEYICTGATTDLVKAIQKHTVADMYNSIVKATKANVTLAKMFKALNINLEDFQEASKAEEVLDSYLAASMLAIKYLGVHDSTRKIVVNGEAEVERGNRLSLTLVVDLIADNGGCDHTWGAWYEETKATCTTNGLDARICAICNHKETKETTATGHSFTNYVYNNDATCTVDGTKTAECDNGCGETDTVTAQGTATGHNFVLDPTTVVKPTCTQDGYTGDKVCDCGEKELGTLDPATGHSFTNYVSNNDATCTQDGTKTATCDNGCGETDTVVDTGSKKPHETHIVNAKAPTCTKDGYTGDERCIHCNALVKEGTVIKATGHNYVKGVCTICGAKNPKTSDNSFVELYAACAMVCLAAIVVLKKKRDLLTKK